MSSLADVVRRLSDFDPGQTIYAKRPWSGSSEAVVAQEPEGGSVPTEAQGLEYFLEVDLALDAAQAFEPDRRLEAVIYYAEHDAYLPE
jgi:hypothetical protein